MGLPGCETQRTQSELAEVRRNVTELTSQVESLQKEVQELRTNLAIQESMQDQYKSVTFDPAAGKGFSRLDTPVGSFAVSIEDVKPYADGVRVRLHVGNLTTATVNGGTFKVKWGPRMPSLKDKDGATHYLQWHKNLKEKEISFTEKLRSGTWNIVNLTLPGIPPQQFGYLELTMDTKEISLLQPR